MKRSRENPPERPVQPGFRIDGDLWRRVRMLALRRRRTATEIMREAVEEYLKRYEGLK